MLDKMTPEEALVEAVRIIGGPAAVGRAFEPPISSQAVSQWRVVPPERCLRLSELSGVSVHLLRPDIYGKSPSDNAPPAEPARAAA